MQTPALTPGASPAPTHRNSDSATTPTPRAPALQTSNTTSLTPGRSPAHPARGHSTDKWHSHLHTTDTRLQSAQEQLSLYSTQELQSYLHPGKLHQHKLKSQVESKDPKKVLQKIKCRDEPCKHVTYKPEKLILAHTHRSTYTLRQLHSQPTALQHLHQHCPQHQHSTVNTCTWNDTSTALAPTSPPPMLQLREAEKARCFFGLQPRATDHCSPQGEKVRRERMQ